MTDGPTTMNGLLHTDEADFDDRAMVASFDTPQAARAARDALIDAGIDAGRISVVDDAACDAGVRAASQPEDDSVVGRIRQAVLPEDSETGTRAAGRNHEAILRLRPLPQEVETAVQVLQAAKPSHFDADLERWRNAS